MFILDGKFKKIVKLLKINKPLVIFDLETTGPAIPKDKIIEIAYIKIWPDGRAKRESIVLNPQIPITHEATTIHGFTKDDVCGKPTFKQKSRELWDVFYGCYYSGFNIMDFDLPILRREFIRVGMDFEYKTSDIIDTKIIYHHMAPQSLSTAYEYYCYKKIKQPHTAIGGTEVASEILIKQLQKYEEVRDKNFINGINELPGDVYFDNTEKFYWRGGEAYFAFSKYSDMSLSKVAEINPKFLQWMITANFSDEIKNIIRKALKK